MTTKRKAPTSAATLAGAAENRPVCETAHVSTNDSIISAADSQTFRIADLLSPGAESAISRRDLMALTGLRDRELRRQIEVERRQGVPILSDNINGYFLPADEQERLRCVRSLRRRAGEIMETAAAIERGGD